MAHLVKSARNICVRGVGLAWIQLCIVAVNAKNHIGDTCISKSAKRKLSHSIRVVERLANVWARLFDCVCMCIAKTHGDMLLITVFSSPISTLPDDHAQFARDVALIYKPQSFHESMHHPLVSYRNVYGKLPYMEEHVAIATLIKKKRKEKEPILISILKFCKYENNFYVSFFTLYIHTYQWQKCK